MAELLEPHVQDPHDPKPASRREKRLSADPPPTKLVKLAVTSSGSVVLDLRSEVCILSNATE